MTSRAANNRPNALHAVVRGRVQGVGYRVFARAAAMRHGCTGWVRNLPDGGVEIFAQAEENVLVELLTELSQGPPWSHVAEIDASWDHLPEVMNTGFRIKR